ncbi:hypothetical protein L6452_35936 [Arctium lappa]|uniref:Uncharacterized protein n=1 Tax=Arctium lappa TaxID=4217 RepID=A0ACB8Y8C4_ARCLA|nr:hypothetical protein L6452_35936 [Arctium lappa]
MMNMDEMRRKGENDDKSKEGSNETQNKQSDLVKDKVESYGKRGCSYKTFSSTRPQEFTGKEGPLDLMDWFNKMEKCFETCQCSADQKVRFVVTTFKTTTLHWWSSKQAVKGIAEATSMTWESLKELMTEKYCSRIDVMKLETEFLQLEQGPDSVQEYTNKFTEKSRFTVHQVAIEQRKVDRFIQGLRKDIKRYVEVTHPKTFLQAVETTKISEKSSDAPAEEKKDMTRKWEGSTKGLKGPVGSLKSIGGSLSKSGNEKKEIPRAKGRAYTMTLDESKETPDVVLGMFLVNDNYAHVLFDSDATRSFVSTTFVLYLNRDAGRLDQSYVVETADGGRIKIKEIVEDFMINIDGNELLVNLMPMNLGGFDVVLGIDWLSNHEAQIVCNKKLIKIPTLDGNMLHVYGERKKGEIGIISMIKASKCMRKGCDAYLAYAIDMTQERKLEDVPIVREYPEVFLEDLPGIPQERKVEFKIDLVPGATPIAKTPYRLAPTEMQELMKQLQELMEKGFIRPSSSPWGAPILFVKKKDGTMRMCIHYR